MNSACVFAVTALLGAACCLGAEQSHTGRISDSMCAAKHKMESNAPNAKLSEAECTRACVKHGAKYVFVSAGKVYQIENQDFAGLEDHAGQRVRVTGEIKGDSLKVSEISTHVKEHKGEKSAL